MTKQEVLQFIKDNPVSALATAEDNKPFVRYIMIYRADEDGIIFCTGENKDMNRQLRQNPMVELCLYNHQSGKQIRVSGTVEEVEDIELKKQIVVDFPFLKEWVDKEGYEVMIVYKLANGKALEWTMETNFAPKEYIDL